MTLPLTPRVLRATFLRPLRGAGMIAADALRAVGLLSVPVVVVGWSGVGVAVILLALLGLVVPRFLGVRPGFDIAFCATILVAAWSSVVQLYVTVPAWDIPMHLVLTGLIAAMGFLLLTRLGILPPADAISLAGRLVLTVPLGLAFAVIWEVGEWAGHTFVSSEVYVGYDDTIGDMVVGGLGSLLAGLALHWFTERQDVRTG